MTESGGEFLRTSVRWTVCVFMVCLCHPLMATSQETFHWDGEEMTLMFPTPSVDSSGSMPIGNGECAANVWIEEATGDLMILLARTDTWDSFGRLLKPGRVRISFEDDGPFLPRNFIDQTLDLRRGTIRIRGKNTSGLSEVRVLADAGMPLIRVEFSGMSGPVRTTLETWRNERRDLTEEEMGNVDEAGLTKDDPPYEEPDVVVSEPDSDRITWYHRNEVSVWPVTMRLQGFAQVMDQFTDPLIHRTSGGTIFSPDTTVNRVDDRTLILTEFPDGTGSLAVVMHTAQTPTPEIWREQLDEQVRTVTESVDRSESLLVHERWWNDFWRRSYIRILTSTPTMGGQTGLPMVHLPFTLGMSSQPGVSGFHG
ncbi:MAG: DUF5703 domain-containing protein, partial [Planctomycetia bacterium]|nr:DUF5703 domain-containing protein [Planctomycetia bacterium]